MTGAKSDLLQIARVLKSNGTEGEILVGFREISPEDLKTKEPVFIYFDGLPVPFFIESFSRRGNMRALVHLTGVKNLADAEEIVGKEVFAAKSAILDCEDGEDGLTTIDDIMGWMLLDADGSEIGKITDYEDIPGNPCLYVETEDGQKMVPFHEDFILSVDEDSQTVSVDLPEGLI
jgi:16S rRNA processing protein RimM